MRRGVTPCSSCASVLSGLVALVAFVGCLDANPSMPAAKSRGTDEVVRLTRTFESEGNPTWSPFGDKIAFEC